MVMACVFFYLRFRVALFTVTVDVGANDARRTAAAATSRPRSVFWFCGGVGGKRPIMNQQVICVFWFSRGLVKGKRRGVRVRDRRRRRRRRFGRLGVTRACIESRGIHQHTAVRLVRDVHR
jgi:hypothetical protein